MQGREDPQVVDHQQQHGRERQRPRPAKQLQQPRAGRN
jgi:hypothetical protein